MPFCGSCGQESPAGFRFCGACGAALAPVAPVAPSDERKLVSILFVDLVGFTARSDQADPEEVQARLRPYHATLKTEIERLGGTVEKFIGDAVMAVFGAPVAREDDAERAVLSALRIIEALDALNAEHAWLNLTVRAAVNTGEALATLSARPERGEGIVTGDVVNTASRLQGVAPVGGVAVGERTYRATRSVIEYAPMEPVSVKGKAQPLELWHALRPRPVSADVGEPAAPLIGRGTDLSRLQQAYAEAVSESTLRLVTVTGEPGVGKTRLVNELFAWVREQPQRSVWRHGRTPRYGDGITFWAFGEVVKSHAGILESDGVAAATAKLARAVADVVDESEREWVQQQLAPLVGSSADGITAGRIELFSAWLTFLRGIASSAPLVMVIEDLHWADDVLVAFLEHLVKRFSGVPLLLICTARPELYERHPAWATGDLGETIALAPLSRDETATLVSALLSDVPLPGATHRALLERSGGNPLYAEEFVRMLLDRGVLERRGNGVELAVDGTIPVPDTVHALVAARLDTLPPARKAVAYDAAVLGRVCWSGGVSTLAGRAETETNPDLHELAAKELLRPARQSSIQDQDEYAFWHAVVQDVAYGQIPRAARSTKHRVAADWLESVTGERAGDHAEVLAFHCTQALDLAPATTPADERALIAERAVGFLVASGDRALHLDLEQAGAFYSRALALCPPGSPRSGRILVKLGWVDSDRGSHAEAQGHLEAAIDSLRETGDEAGMGNALTLLARTVWRNGEAKRAQGFIREAVEVLQAQPPGPELIDAYNESGRLSMMAARFDDAIRWAGKAIDGADALGLERPVVRALTNRGMSRAHLGDHEQGIADLQHAQELGLRLGIGLETMPTFGNLAWSLGDVEGPAAALQMADQGVAFAQRRGLAFPAMMVRTIRAEFLFKLGRWDEALAVAEAVLEWEQVRRAGQIRLRATRERCRVLALSGRVDEAAAPLEELLGAARTSGDPQSVVPILALGATIELARGRGDEAVGLAREILAAGSDDYRLRELTLTMRVLTRCDALEDAEAQLAGLTPASPRQRAVLASAHAELAEARGDLAGAADQHAGAAAAWGRLGDRVEEAFSVEGAGRCLAGLGDAEAAAQQTAVAHTAFAGFMRGGAASPA